MLGELHYDQMAWESEVDQEEAQEPGVLVHNDTQTSARLSSSYNPSPTSIDSSESFEALVNNDYYYPAYSQYSSLKLPRQRSQRTKRHFGILPPNMHLPQSISDALHLNGGSSSPSYETSKALEKDATSQQDKVEAQSNNQVESLRSGDAKIQTNGYTNDKTRNAIETSRNRAQDQDIGEAEPHTRGQTEPQAGSQMSSTVESNNKGDAMPQENDDTNARTHYAIEELKNTADVESDRNTGSQCNSYVEPPVNGIAEMIKGGEEFQSDGHFEPQTKNAQEGTNCNANHISNGDAVSVFEGNGGTYVQSNDKLTLQTNGANGSNVINNRYGIASLPNSIHIPFLDTLLDSITAGWILLILRYQRDTFHSFTWGVKDAVDSIQTVATEDLRLGEAVTVADLLDVVRRVRSRECDVSTMEQPVLFFNDGTKDEVNTSHISR
jgi:hypothetical protein